MKIKLRFPILLTVIIGISLFINGCGPLSHHGRFQITTPNQNQTFLPTDHITITLHRWVSVAPYHYFRYQIRDNGNVIEGDSRRAEQNEVQIILTGDSEGTHTIDARAQAWDTATSHSDWYPADPVCIYVGENPPTSFICNQYAWPQNLEYVPVTPTVPVFTIVTETPETPPRSIIIIHSGNSNNANNNGGGSSNSGGSGGATGCAAYSDQASCNLAGCSWLAGSCIVSP